MPAKYNTNANMNPKITKITKIEFLAKSSDIKNNFQRSISLSSKVKKVT
jgi:hypothetical protein